MRQFPLLLLSACLLVAVAAAPAGYAQPVRSLDPGKSLTQYQLDAWTTEDGLPQNSVSAVIQTRDGYLWLGTQEGLVRFDGTRFDVHSRRTGALRNNNVVALHEDSHGNLWIGTLGGGLTRYNGGSFSTYTTESGLSSNYVTALLEDREGGLWVGTADAGLTRLRGNEITYFTTTDGLAASSISSLHQDRAGALWIGTVGGGLSRFRDGQFNSFSARDGLAGNDVTSLWEDGKETLWIGTRSGLTSFTGGEFRSYTTREGLPTDQILTLRSDAAGSLWIGTDHGGLVRFRDGRFSALSMEGGLVYDVVRTLYEDTEGSLWIGTDGGGLNRLRDGKFTTHTTEDGLAHDFAYAIFEDAAGSLWIGTDAGVSRLRNGRFTTFTTRDGLSSNYVLSVYGSRDGSIWIGTYGAGLNRLLLPPAGDSQPPRVLKYRVADGLPGDEIYALYEASNGDMWVGTRYGLSRFRDGSFTSLTTADGLSSNDVTAIAEDGDGRLWVGTYDGGLNVLEDGRVVKQYAKRDGLLSNFVLSIYPDKEGNVWIGTREGGLDRFRNNRLTSIAPADGLFDENVFQILEDGRGNLWLSSNQGLFRVSKEEVNDFAEARTTSVTSVPYDRSDGLLTTEFNGGFQPAGWRGRDGRLWFPTNRGIVSVDPERLALGLQPPRVVIERLTADGESLPLDGRVTIPPGKSKFEFDYVGITFLAPGKVQYRYRLDGVDDDWVAAGSRREAFYTNLSPGNYTFRVMATSGDGGWGDEVTAAVYLRPYIHQTTLFRILSGLFLVLAALAAYRLRVRHLRIRHKELLELVDEHTRNLREEKERTEHLLLETETAWREAEEQTLVARNAREIIEGQAAQLRELDKMRTRFFNNISHEFRTPLTLTIGPLENALTGEYGAVNPTLRKQLELVLRNARRLLRLINQLLDLAKLESGKMELSLRHGDLVPLVEGVVLSFTAFAEKKDLELAFSSDEEDLIVSYDPEALEKVFFNLLSNAVKFTPQGGRVEVRLGTRQAGDEPLVEIIVRDTGIGIPAEELPYIFDRFHQVDGAVGHISEGTGIGLSLVKELVALHGGTIEVASEPGAGTEFVVTVPLVRHRNPVAAGAESWTSDGDGLPDISRGPMVEMSVFDDDAAHEGDGSAIPLATGGDGTGAAATILVVDDSPDVREYVSSILEAQYTIITATDGLDALEKARETEPDLVISDVMMPYMDGYGLCRSMKADERLRHVPVILLTARANQEDRIEGLEAGSIDYIAKPFSARELHARVHNLLLVRSQQKTLQLLNVELEGKNVALQEVTEMKTQLLNIAAHDMKNPLNTIREFAKILKKELGEDSDVFDPLDLIHKSSDQMLHLVSTLLDSSAIESGRVQLDLTPVNVSTLSAAVVRRNQPQAEAKGQEIVLSISEERCLVEADKNRLLEAMDNLVNNAVKFSPHGKKVHVTVRRTPTEVHFEVKDEGPGLSEEDKSKLFGQFQRLSAQPTGGESSSGLGLAIVKQIVELHGGRVVAESEKGEGSRFGIELPAM